MSEIDQSRSLNNDSLNYNGNALKVESDEEEIEIGGNPKFLPLIKKLESIKITEEETIVDGESSVIVCPGGKFQCPNGCTCCQNNSTGGWGCCPFTKAVCCSDGKHCCPTGETCDLKHEKCVSADGDDNKHTPLSVKTEATPILTDGEVEKKEIHCADNVSTCPDKTTCCQMKNGYYGCCQYDQAICCDDYIHCCPQSMTCNSTTGTCGNDQFTLKFGEAWEARKPLLKVSKDADCPDKKSSCPEATTCCEMPTGGYGCCPYEDAQCCSDKIHCCSEEEKCDVAGGKCVHKITNVQTLFKSKLQARLKEEQKEDKAENTLCPDKSTSCFSNSTCCATSPTDYGCCPMPKAVCCSDRRHCCPSGYKCHSTTGQCMKSGESEGEDTLIEGENIKIVAEVKSGNVLCPDKKSSCQDGSTCCGISSGAYGCCPYVNASCCSDHTHCCPSGYTCDLTTSKCNKNGEHGAVVKSVPWFTKRPALQRQVAILGDITCPDNTTTCSSGMTCCSLLTGNYGCCPLPKAVCCTDGLHCCPDASTCDVKAGRCISNEINSFATSWYRFRKSADTTLRFQPVGVEGSDIVCPGKKTKCSSSQTCCKLQSGGMGCCPMPKAVCCSDGLHCCPANTKCDIKTAMCSAPDGDELVLQSVAGDDHMDLVKIQVENVVCPDQKALCADNETCCETSTGAYGCCPQAHAVCCADKQHCCPEGTTCDTKAGTCNRNNDQVISVWENVRSKNEVKAVDQDVVCPDQKSKCASGQTCCQTDTGIYGCCPQPNAVCCADKQHCCPQGTTCDTKAGTCNRNNNGIAVTWNNIHGLKSSTEVKVSVGDVICPDKKEQCPHDTTCCATASGDYGCCPLPAAVCCADKQHCCPHGTTCDTAAGKCNGKNGFSISFDDIRRSSNQSAEVEHQVSVGDVICPDKKEQCHHDTTCCATASGDYGCCPLPAAVCCADKQHCCPHGTTCDTAAGKCNGKNGFSISFDDIRRSSKKPAEVEHQVSVGDVICPDKKEQCHHDTTCCATASGDYGCCPLPAAVCCADKQHCCPHGTTCDTAAGKCNGKNGFSISFDDIRRSLKKSAEAEHEVSVGDVICPDKKEQCHHDTTCCATASGDYGCCPLPAAVCCADKQHCCPHGTTCDTAAGKCNGKNGFSISFDDIRRSSKKSAEVEYQVKSRVEDVVCPGNKTQCHHDTTCCQTTAGDYGCCPLPAAVCCADKQHCCPHGTTCDTKAGTCSSNNNGISITWDKVLGSDRKTTKVINQVKSSVEDVVCPGNKTQCHHDTTCCQTTSGGYGCCPLPAAVCCADKQHCCPHGTTCDTKAGTCSSSENGFSVSWDHIDVRGSGKKTENKIIEVEAESNGDRVVCPGKFAECNKGQTCCKTKGGFGCCPYEGASCCTDMQHCCANGTVCNASSKTCDKKKPPIHDASSHLPSETSGLKVSWDELIPHSKNIKKANVGANLCPDKTECPWDSTCCKSAGKYTCCTGRDASCCADNMTCCPAGFLCDTDGSQTTCKKAGTGFMVEAESHTRKFASLVAAASEESVPWVEKFPAQPVSGSSVSDAIICPDRQHECPNYNTCCRMGGTWGCCPQIRAVCCSDGRHCCPAGYTCDTGRGACVKPTT